ncbi:MAG TPA: TRAP transporter large permease [Thermodesulfobacteriota bacterium]|nr:TRAP transporter large permease [Thermodesulfobacteriota bacterium]
MAAALWIVFLVGGAIGIPLAFVMGGSGLVALVVEGKLSLMSVPQRFFNGINSFPLMAVPFFILAADLMSASAITSSILRFTNSLVGHIRGGLGHVAVLSEMVFSGISGSALADAAGPGAVMMRMMQRAGYESHYSAAFVAATAVLGPLIPPSIIAIVYAMADSRVTVAGLFMAGVVPGILVGGALALTNYVISVRHGYKYTSKKASWGDRLRSLWKATPALTMPLIIFGGILSGIFTVTEAAAVAVFYALFVGLFLTRKLNFRIIMKVFLQGGLVSSAALLIVAMASLFSWLLTILQLPQTVALTIGKVTTSPMVVMWLVALFVFICGKFLDVLPAVIILVPVLAPLTDQFHIDPLYFANCFILNISICLVTPPVAGVLFVITSISRLKFERISRAILPMVLAELVVLVFVILFPALSVVFPGWLGFTH